MFGGFWLTVPTVADIFLFGGAAPQHSFSTWQGFMNSQVSHSRSSYITERVRRFTQQSSGHDVNVPRLDEKTTDERGHFGDFGSESMLPSFTHSAAGISGARQQRRAAVASVASLELLL